MTEWRICDATLREGLQSGLPVFAADPDKTAYAGIVLGEGLADAVEVYRPGPRIGADALADLTARWGSRIRVYCGVAHRLDAVPACATSISVTLLGSRREEGVELVRALAEERPEVAVRVGLECVSRWEAADRRRTVRALTSIATVESVALCDSNGELIPGELQSLAASISEESGTAIVGGHFHDDFGLATANAAAFLSDPAARREVDVTLGGIGERVGIPSLEAVLTLREGSAWARGRRDTFATLRALAGSAFGDFDRTPLSGGGYVADSHRTANGTLREEYRDLY